MKTIVFLVMTAISVLSVSAQKQGNKSPLLKKEIVKSETGNLRIIESNNDGIVLIQGELKSENPEIKHGNFKFFNPEGKLICTGRYLEDYPSGIWHYFDEKGDTLASYNYDAVINFILNNTMDKTGEIYFLVEDMPKFQGGGIDKFRQYISENLNYPVYAQIKGYTGRAFVQFVVDSLGEIKNIEVVRGAGCLDLNMEALRVITESPKWEPGLQRKEKVNVQFTIPIVFSF